MVFPPKGEWKYYWKCYWFNLRFSLWYILQTKRMGAMGNLQSEFYAFCDQAFNKRKAFSQLLIDKIDEIGVDAFNDKTHLNGDKLYKDCKKNDYYKPEMYTLVSIIIGLQLDKAESEDLLKSAGRALEPIDLEYNAYRYVMQNIYKPFFIKILKEKDGDMIEASNKVLREIGVEDSYLLGSHQRK